jgi:lactoylglutathione lyase
LPRLRPTKIPGYAEIMTNGVALRSFPMLSVDDLGKSLRFYRDVLGFTEAYRFPDGDDAVFVTLTAGASEMGIGQIGSGPPLHGQAQRPASGHRVELCVYVDDVDVAVDRARRAKVRVVLEPAEQAWGERIAYIEDPNGNLVMLTQDLAPARARPEARQESGAR